jgi:metal-responsive CopG/Arc/MetJ family transcriptional regulator
MAEDKNTLLHVDLSKFPELLEDFDEIVTELDTDRSKLIRQLMREKVEEYKHLGGIKKRVVSPKIKQVVRS